MQDQSSNMVYVVPLDCGTPERSRIPWIDIVRANRRYFHPTGGKRWPKAPPNYLGFRYHGRLQAIHHVDSWQVTDDLHSAIEEIRPGKRDPHFVYVLGEPIVPPRRVPAGKVYPSGRVWAALDLLLTCGTVSEARDQTQRRLR